MWETLSVYRALIGWALCIALPGFLFLVLTQYFNKHMDYQKAVDKAAKITITIAAAALVFILFIWG